MSRAKLYKGYVIFLEEDVNSGKFFATVHKNLSQIDYTVYQKTPELAYQEAEKIIDRLEK